MLANLVCSVTRADGVLLHAREVAAGAHAADAAHGVEPAVQAQVLQDVARGGPPAARARPQAGRGAADAQDSPGVREVAARRGAARLQPAQPVRRLRRLLHAHLQVRSRSVTRVLHFTAALQFSHVYEFQHCITKLTIMYAICIRQRQALRT